jgi:Polysaccharide pyruvyl transferase
MRLFLIGATPSFDPNTQTKPKTRLAVTGGNSGNQIIAYGLLQTLQYDAVNWSLSIGPERANAEYDVIVIPAANFLFPAFDFGGVADFIERTKLPVVMVGLGAQANDMTNPAISLKEGTIRLVKVVSERSALIGVRGEFTARVLAHLGINNVQITGCPSYYMAGKAGYNIRSTQLTDGTPIAVHASRDVFGHSFDADKMRSVVNSLYFEAARRNGIFVAQTEMDEITLAESKDQSERDAALARLMTIFKDIGHPDLMKAWFDKNMRVYWSVPEWLAAMKAYSFVVGTRFHGTIAALQAGTPAVCICHDTRTTEMCEFLGIPNVGLKTMDHVDVTAIHAGANVQHLQRRYDELYPRFVEFLVENKLLPRKEVAD